MISQDPKISQDLIRFLYFPDGFTPLFEAVERVLAEVEVADRWNEES